MYRSSADRISLLCYLSVILISPRGADGGMEKEERMRELRKLLEEPLAVPFPEAHKRIEELVGRPVWTHEMATPESLYDEIMTVKGD